ncbi:unnamed protein product [Ascophyllum nodosum]
MVDYVDILVDVVGFVAGLLVSIALVPQIYRAHKRKSAKDLSYSWQVTLAVGVVFQLLYLYHYDLWSAFVPLVGELVLILYLTGLKLYFHDGDNAPGEGKISTLYTNGVTNGAVDDKGAAEEGEIKYQGVRDQRRSSRNGGGVVGESGAGQGSAVV